MSSFSTTSAIRSRACQNDSFHSSKVSTRNTGTIKLSVFYAPKLHKPENWLFKCVHSKRFYHVIHTSAVESLSKARSVLADVNVWLACVLASLLIST